MDEFNKEDQAIQVNTSGANVVYAVPAKPKQKPPFWSENFGGLLIIFGCFVMIGVISVF